MRFIMANMTLSIVDETKRRMDAHPSIRWSNVVRSIIDRKLDDFEEAERLAKKSNLALEDFEGISGKLRSGASKRALRLLHESNG